jgi:hypothetical protein
MIDVLFLLLGILFFMIPIVRQQKKLAKIEYHKYSQKSGYDKIDIVTFVAASVFILHFLVSIFFFE